MKTSFSVRQPHETGSDESSWIQVGQPAAKRSFCDVHRTDISANVKSFLG